LGSSCLCNKHPQFRGLLHTNVFSYSAGGQKSETGFTKLKSRCHLGCNLNE
jgi:hypothetical protein